MWVRPARIESLPEQYFGALLARVAVQAALEGEPLIDLGRGNPETGPPAHVVDEDAEVRHARGADILVSHAPILRRRWVAISSRKESE